MKAKRLRAACEHAYMLAVCFFLLWDIPYMTEAQWTFDVRGAFPAAWCALAAAALALMRRRPGTLWLSAGLLAWMSAMSAYRGVLDVQGRPILQGVLAFLAILPAPCIVTAPRLKRYLRGLLAFWTGFLTAQAAVGLWAALTGHAVFSLKGTWYIGVNLGDNRLYLNAYVTTGAVKLGLSVLLAAMGAVISKRRAAKAVYSLCMLVQLACLALTDCRTAFIAVGAALGLAACAGLRTRVKRPGIRAAALLAIPLCTVAAYLLLSGTLTALAPHVERELDNITMLELPAHLLPEAAAETAVQHRELQAGNLFNDRQVIWTAALRLLGSEPRFLLTGTTTALSPVMTNLHILPGEYAGRPFAHVHNIYLQTLVSWGVPGFALLAALIVCFLISAWRVLFRHDVPLWQRLAPVPTLYVLLCDMVDCFTRLSEGSAMLLYACFFAGLTMACDRRARRRAYENAPVTGRVDVIVPVFNAGGYLERAVHSALAAGAARVILVDDGSTDGSAAVCDALAAQDGRILVRHQENRGASAARNVGLALAEAELVAFLDADDQLLPGSLAALAARLGDADAIQGCILRNMDESIPGNDVTRLTAREALAAALSDPTRHLLCHGWLFRRKLLTERFDEALTLGEDGEWLLRTLMNASSAAYCCVPAYCYSVRTDSALHGGGVDTEAEYLRTLEAAGTALERLDMPQPAALYRLTHLLLMLTHGDVQAAPALREQPLFDGAFRQAKLSGLSGRMLTLRLLRRRAYAPVKLAVALRRLRNRLCGGNG